MHDNTQKSIFSMLSEALVESEMKSFLKELKIYKLMDRTVSSLTVLRGRVDEDVDTLRRKLKYLGFYKADVGIGYVIKKNKVKLILSIKTGPKYRILVDIKCEKQDCDFSKTYTQSINKRIKYFYATMEDISHILKMVIKNFQTDGYYDANIYYKNLQIDDNGKTAVLNLSVNQLNKGVFGKTSIVAFPGINTEFIKNRICWKEGDSFDISKVDDTLSDLRDSQIFMTVNARKEETKIVDNKVPMIIELEEDKKHTFEMSVLYTGVNNTKHEKTSGGDIKSILTKVSWTRNNAFGGGEYFKASMDFMPLKLQSKRANYAFNVSLTKADTFFVNNVADYDLSRKQEFANAYFKKNDKLSADFLYNLNKLMAVNVGCYFEDTYIDANDKLYVTKKHKYCDAKYEVLAQYCGLLFDATNSLLNPTSGYRGEIKFTNMKLNKADISSLQSVEATCAYHLPLNDDAADVFSVLINCKTLCSQAIDKIPHDKRLYAGGIKSVRGYADQMATEVINGTDIPFGGKTMVEMQSEIRHRISKNVGCVAFFDAAKVMNNTSGNKELKIQPKRWFSSIGFGIRYFSAIGPIRLDFAFPIKRRNRIDSKMQFIMSLGQAF